MTDKLSSPQELIKALLESHLLAIRQLFPENCKLTLVGRNTDTNSIGLLMSYDEIPLVIAMLKKHVASEEHAAEAARLKKGQTNG